MNINDFRRNRLGHALHYQYNVEVGELLDKFGATLNIPAVGNTFRIATEKEGQCYKIIRKSDISEEKEEADIKRDDTINGTNEALKAILRHFNPEIKASAKRLKIVFDEYNHPKPIAKMPYDAETAAINNLLADLKGQYATDVDKTGIREWITELERRNNDFQMLAKGYNEQQAKKNDFRMVDVRKETDEALDNVITVIKGDIIRNGEYMYNEFVAEMNKLTKHYADILAQHKGRLAAKKNRQTSNEANEETVNEEQ
jgi:hypothetical protein